MMKERGILFSGPMVKALLSGAKSQTRRVVKPQPETYSSESGLQFEWPGWHGSLGAVKFANYCPHGVVGDRLWVRETHYVESAGYADGSGRFILYRATEADAPVSKWTPSIHMPRWASRITLEITDIRVQRVQDISEEDAKAEGVFDAPDADKQQAARVAACEGRKSIGPVDYFRELWQSINGPESWAANPWCWCLTFKRLETGAESGSQGKDGK